MANGIFEKDTKFEASEATASKREATLIPERSGTRIGYISGSAGFLSPNAWNLGESTITVTALYASISDGATGIAWNELEADNPLIGKTLMLEIDGKEECDFTMGKGGGVYSAFSASISRLGTHTIKYKVT